MLPVVALVGRPNVGKSTLFNRFVGYRKAIVEDTPGVTRDRLYADCEWQNKQFTVIDTGGINFSDDDPFVVDIRYQVDIAAQEADVIVFVVDGREGINPLDQEIAGYLRGKDRPVIIACNKIDTVNLNDEMYEFYNLGYEVILPISASNGQGTGDLLDSIVDNFPFEVKENDLEDNLKVAIVGKPNVGKSSLTNKLLGEERTIVSNIPGTTRDSIDSKFKYNKRDIVLIDTAGLRRKGKIKEDIERFSVSRTLSAVDRCDIALILIDAVEGISEQDKKIAGYAYEKGRGCIIVVNKWDLPEKDEHTLEQFKKKVYSEIPFLKFAPMVFISAKTGQRLHALLELIEFVSEQQNIRIPTGTLNTVIEEATFMTPPPSSKGKQLRILYCTQTGVKPPMFVLFVNNKKLMHFSYQRHLENVIREIYGFVGTPIKWKINERSRSGDK
ncbi:ribosome biogenesis GTPase Der [Clostridium sp. 'deep sea']|uniref:ribosome biogenesis GTPase Der n=1 Tax=Clostridium sp. 'deep sea' TaxID=2779445 RepID=UPI001896A108|nr:ribosome biogenesis GTPase Der [Clostridium sp. 'deep sea']QOR35806.1 ribosome biogenesis GTPase Der [Clostridium sp. 'deep sea']